MANVVKPHKVKNGAIAVNYVLGKKDGRGHNGHEQRNELIYMRNMHHGESIISQMQTQWDLASEQHTNQCLTMVFGFSEKEMPSDDENSPYLAVTIVNDYMDDLEKRDILPRGHQCLLAVQQDGKSGLTHCHAVFNDVNSITHRGLPKEMNWGPFLTKDFQEYCEKAQLFKVDYGKDASRDHEGVNYTRTEQALREQGKPVFKDIVRGRIDEAVNKTADYDSFKQELKNLGVSIEEKTSKKGKKQYKYIVDPDTLNGLTNKTNNYSLRSTSLGPRFSPEAIEMGFAFRKQHAAPKEPSRMSAEEFMKQTGDRWWADGQDAMTAYQQMHEAYEEYKRTGKLPSDEEENYTNVPETEVEPVTEEQVVAPVITSDEEESQRKKRKATKSNITIETIETVEKQNVSGASVKNRYSRYSSAVKHDIGSQSDAMVAAVMRKAENIPDAKSDKDRYYGE